MEALTLFKSLADETRLKIICLLASEEELCVCEFSAALAVSQPKISRHLAILKQQQLLTDRKDKQWVYYQLNPQLTGWAHNIVQQTSNYNQRLIENDLRRLAEMGERPSRQQICCT